MGESGECGESLTSAQLESLGEEIAVFALSIDLAEHALITKLRIFDAHEGWGEGGFLSCAQWLSWRTGLGIKAAREKVRVARALGELGQIDAAFGAGQLSYSKVRAITRVATADNEQELLDIALRTTAAQVERLARAYRRVLAGVEDSEGVGEDRRRFVRRAETIGGMVRIEIQLPPEEAAVVWDAIMSVGDRGQASATVGQASAGAPVLAGAAVQASAEAPAPGEASAEASAPGLTSQACAEASAEERADALVSVARAYLKHCPRTLGSGYELVVLTSKEQLEQGPGGVGGFLRDGTPVPIEVARMLACDSARVEVVVGEDGQLLDVGRRTRTIPSAIGRALWLRDGGCRVPGCGRRRHLHGHHVRGWAEGGATCLSNLVLVCPGHHRMIHEGQLAVEVRAGAMAFVDRRGRELHGAPSRDVSGRELEELERFVSEVHPELDPSVLEPGWDGRPMDLRDALDWMILAEQSRPRAVGACVQA